MSRTESYFNSYRLNDAKSLVTNACLPYTKELSYGTQAIAHYCPSNVIGTHFGCDLAHWF